MSLTAKLVLSPLLAVQALHTRKRTPRLAEADGAREGVEGEGAELTLLIAGDSSAAGVGVAHQRDALAPRLAAELAQLTHRRVRWRLVAQSGLTTAQLLQRLQAEALPHFDLAVVVSGVNDVVDQVPSQRAVDHREALANYLRNALGVAHVVFAPLPPVHHFPGLPQPLRWVAGADARRHDHALKQWARTREDVSHAVMEELKLNRGVMASDGFHPGERAYRQMAHDLARHVARHVLRAPPKPARPSAGETLPSVRFLGRPPVRGAGPATADAPAAPSMSAAPEMALCIDRHALERARATAHPLNRRR